MTIYHEIKKLLTYGIEQQLIQQEDVIYSRNRILAALQLEDWEESVEIEYESSSSPQPILKKILDWAYENGRIKSNSVTERDLLDAEIMNCMLPRPSELIREFYHRYHEKKEAATDYFYHLSTASNYIHTDRIAKNKIWKTKTVYGDIDITINLSKPEKDPKEIALLKSAPASTYPTCLLCAENEGYQGTLRHPARSNHRIIPIQVNNEKWFLQYSPYVYYNEHCIVFNEKHVPMKMSKSTFERLLDFVDAFPHYFIGSNADIPIVGGSILSHDHFQGGKYTFAIERAEVEHKIQLEKYPSVTIGTVKWPMSVVRVTGPKEEVLEVTNFIYQKWLAYSDESVDIHSHTNETPHNTVTPIARRRGDLYEMDVVLRNNRTTEEYPFGIFHPHEELHHIKKENIGLIEVMGLAVLPGRLATELEQLAEYLLESTPKENWAEDLVKHFDWFEYLQAKYSDITSANVNEILQNEVGAKFQTVLEHAGVYKRTKDGQKAFIRFLQELA